jgi:transcriptional regulator with XRE-family HTH domain
VAGQERAIDRAVLRARRLRQSVGSEVRFSRLDRDLSIAAVAAATGISESEVSRIERGLAPGVPIEHLCVLGAVVGLEITLKAFPGGQPLRDRPQVALLGRFRALLPDRVVWRSEVGLPIVGDQCAWDATITGVEWRYGVEAETGPRDAQALARRIGLKVRDSDVDGVLLILPSTRRAKAFLREAGPILAPNLPIPGADALRRLRAGDDPGGSGIIVI